MKLEYRPEDFVVRESWRFDEVPRGGYQVYALDKQKVTTFEAVDRLAKLTGLPRSAISFCGLKDKQGRTEQLIAFKGAIALPEKIQEADLRLRRLGETDRPLSARNTSSNRFAVTVRDLDSSEIDRLPESVAEVNRLGVINYFDSQRFGHLKHGQGFIAKDLLKGQWEHALHNLVAQPSPLDQSSDAQLKTFWRDNWGQWSARGAPPPDPRMGQILRKLRERPQNFKAAFLTLEPRYRALILFTYQSFLWNEGVKLLLLSALPRRDLCQIPYQAGALLFPRAASGPARELLKGTFPLLGPETPNQPESIGKAIETVLRREKLALSGLRIPDSPLFFKHEDRPLSVVPGKLLVGQAARDELFRGRFRIHLAFTLPSGAYATLVVRRLLWFALEGQPRTVTKPERPVAKKVPAVAAGGEPKVRGRGFLAKKRARREARRIVAK